MNSFRGKWLTFSCESLWNCEGGIRWESNYSALLSKTASQFTEKLDEKSGFYQWPNLLNAKAMQEIKDLAQSLAERFDQALVFGIGGSHLGPEAIIQVLQKDKSSFPIQWLSNVDPQSVREAERFLQRGKTAAIIISKSGGTAETMSGFFHFFESFPQDSIVAITDPDTGFLRQTANSQNWASLPVPANVGGRFSVLTAVGLFPAALAGIDPQRILAGAQEMKGELEAVDAKDNPAYQIALSFYLWDTEKGRSLQYLMPYWKSLRWLADWWVQLWGESIGKKRISDDQPVGFTPVACLGTMDQHSLLQLFKEGPPNKVVGFVNVSDSSLDVPVGQPALDHESLAFLTRSTFGEISQKASAATQTSLTRSGCPTYAITLPKLTPEALGAWFFFWETACGFAGELYGVNAYNQPGVEEAKKLLKASLT